MSYTEGLSCPSCGYPNLALTDCRDDPPPIPMMPGPRWYHHDCEPGNETMECPACDNELPPDYEVVDEMRRSQAEALSERKRR